MKFIVRFSLQTSPECYHTSQLVFTCTVCYFCTVLTKLATAVSDAVSCVLVLQLCLFFTHFFRVHPFVITCIRLLYLDNDPKLTRYRFLDRWCHTVHLTGTVQVDQFVLHMHYSTDRAVRFHESLTIDSPVTNLIQVRTSSNTFTETISLL